MKLDEASPEKVAARGRDSDGDDKTALGISVAPLTPDLASRLGAPKDERRIADELDLRSWRQRCWKLLHKRSGAVNIQTL